MGSFEDDLRFGDLKIEFADFNLRDAVANCGGSADLCVELMKDFVTEERLVDLNQAFRARDWEEYQGLIHSLKGAVRTFGLREFGRVAEQLQFAAEDKNEAYILENHQDMTEMYGKLLDVVKRMA